MYSNPTRWRGFCYDAKDNITNDPNCNGKHRQKMRQGDCTLMPTGSQQLVSGLKNRGRFLGRRPLVLLREVWSSGS